VRSAVELGRALDLTLVAEGIETSANLKMLEEIGADIGQGYVIAQPLSSMQLDKFLAPSYAANAASPVAVTVGGR
jgi:EAL domain-containing protein (putative c-di-GMP-specific phosphodiesterase class I)